MISKLKLYTAILEFFLWVNEFKKHQDIEEFTNGMKLIKNGVSTNVDIWLDWDRITPDEIKLENAYDYFKLLLQHWIEKDDIVVFKQIFYMFDPEDFEYKKEVPEKWNELINADSLTMNFEEESTLSVWAGTFLDLTNSEFREEWIEEKFDRLNPDLEGYSKFMELYKVGWYDHDFQEISFSEKMISVEEIIKNYSYYESFEKLVISAAHKKEIKDCNVMIIIFDFEYSESKGEELKAMPLKFLGSFPYTTS